MLKRLNLNMIYRPYAWKGRFASVCGMGVLLFMGCVVNSYADQDENGRIEEFTCHYKDFELRRGESNRPIRVRPNTVLYTGDKITVTRQRQWIRTIGYEYCSIKLLLNDGSRETLDYSNSSKSTPYIVPTISLPDEGNILTALWGNASDWVGSWFNKEPDKIIGAYSKGTKPYIPLLITETSQTAKLIAGKEGIKELHLAWKGGKASYIVKVQKRVGNGFVSLSTTRPSKTTTTVRFKKRPLRQGIYRLLITDNNRQNGQQRFEVVNSLPPKLQSIKQKIEQVTAQVM
jgi:hypothetical protein